MTRFARYKKTHVDSDGFKSRTLTKSKNEERGNKDERSEIRREKRISDKKNKMVCFNCRKPGHSVKDCTLKNDNTALEGEMDNGEIATGICYHCGTMEHSSKNCNHINKKKFPFKFATCFLCKQDGHLASKCQSNTKGLYPNGGGCKHCNSVEHYAKDCAMEKKNKGSAIELGVIDLEQGADDDDVFLELYKKQKKRAAPQKPVTKKKTKVVNF